jgi:signal transduction histidine kinase
MPNSATVANLPLYTAVVSEDTSGEEVDRLLRNDPALPGVIVQNDSGAILGVISRTAFLDQLSRRFGNDLYLHRPIRQLMAHLEGEPLRIAAGVPLQEAAHLVLARPPAERDLPLLVTLPDGGLALIEAEAVLQAMCHLLETTIAELSRTQEQLVEARKLSALADVVAGIAHEINTPVGNGVTAASHLADTAQQVAAKLEAGALKKSELKRFLATVREDAQLIANNLSRAAELIRSFKQVAADERSEARRCFSLRGYLQDIIFNLRPRLKRTPHEISIDCPVDLELDSYPGALSQVILNLIINALDHAFTAEKGGHITVSARPLDGEVEIAVSDDGKGIPPEDLPHIFERFFSTSRHTGGTGLGLFIVQSLVVGKLKGTVTCESHVGEGTIFTIRIPRTVGNGAL